MTTPQFPEATDRTFDLIVLGSGVAGLSAAVHAAQVGLSVAVITKGLLDQGTTRWAQGGVAAALGREPEALDVHLADTLAAGAGLCDAAAVRKLVEDGPLRVEELVVLGANFDKDPDGSFQLAREGGHSVFRILHAGGSATGFEVERALIVATQRTAAEIYEQHFAVDLLVEGGRCVGLSVLGPEGVFETRATHVLIAAGGGGQLFEVTTNPVEATGDGVAMALRAGVGVADVEFFQFHPTALAVDQMPRPLLTEALRGHGALLLDAEHGRFVNELLPRDVVSRAILAKMAEEGSSHVWLDCRALEDFAGRFPNIFESLAEHGLNPAVDLLPVAPAAHHQCGGIVTDLRGATTLPGLWAAGETSCSGVHGANRLASNSLLEGLVFGPAAVASIAVLMGAAEGDTTDGPEATGAMRAHLGDRPGGVGIGGRHLDAVVAVGGLNIGPVGEADDAAAAKAISSLQKAMSAHASVIRSAESLRSALVAVDALDEPAHPASRTEVELCNLMVQARALIAAAASREESRGCHSRSDFPTTADGRRYRQILGIEPVVPDVELEGDHHGS